LLAVVGLLVVARSWLERSFATHGYE
jgi:hypothetical protein